MAPMSKKQLSKLGLAALAVISIAERRRKQRSTSVGRRWARPRAPSLSCCRCCANGNRASFAFFCECRWRCCEMLSDLPNRGMLVVPLSIRFGCQNVEDWGSSPHLNQLRLMLVVAPICHFCAVFLGSRDVTSREKSARTWRNGKKPANSLDWPILSASTAQTMNCASRVRSDSQLASYPIHFLNRIGRRRKPSEASYTTESKLKRTAQTIIYIVGSVGNRWVGQLRRISSWCEAGLRQAFWQTHRLLSSEFTVRKSVPCHQEKTKQMRLCAVNNIVHM